ncbi:MAG TPA: PIN domain-containing protein [Polyangiaceae bacterium]|nr:PIN domain-containing protein [Polyangiaceae bacterium]HMR74075.1 PIN domain-containing protein [Polyangiaceae bacterium]
MTRALLDTDILSEIIKGRNETVFARASAYLTEHGRFTTSAVSVAEVIYGLRRVAREDRIVQFEASLDTVEVLPFDDAAARLAGRINADLEQRGRIIGMPDVLIAAIALRARVPVATGNVAHFEYVQSVGYDLLIDNWKSG